jgi:hypothetical protein
LSLGRPGLDPLRGVGVTGMWARRGAIIYVAALAVVTALTLVGTYYFVEWVSPPFNMYGARSTGTGVNPHVR